MASNNNSMTPADGGAAGASLAAKAALWSFGKAWPHRFGQSGVRYHIRQCIAVLRAERAK